MKKTLVILAHPDISQSRLNKTLIESIKNLKNVTINDIYSNYKNFDSIDVNKEQLLLLEHDRIIFEFPLYWFSTPGLLKDWQDKVLEYGFAYGSKGNSLLGKEFKIATTIGGPEEVYNHEADMKTTINEFLKPLEIMSLFTQMKYTEPFTIYGALNITDEDLQQKAEEYKALLISENWN